MMRTHFLKLWILIFIFSGCVSVNLPLGTRHARATNIDYENPQDPFIKQNEEKNLDGLWISKITKSTIGFYSLCSPNLPPLRNARSNSLNGIEEAVVVHENIINYNQREALQSVIQGKLEGFQFQIESILFIKDSCLFEISYVSYKDNFQKEYNIFKKFVQDFKVK